MQLSECSTLIQSLAKACEANRTAPKWLIAPSARVGNQWITTLARAGVSVLNLHVVTVRGMALDRAQAGMDALGLRYAGTAAIELIIQAAFESVRARMAADKATPYFTNLKAGPGLVRTMSRTVQDLRLAGMRSEALAADLLEVSVKALELSLLLEEYARILAEKRYADYAQVLELALSSPPPENHLYLLPSDLELNALEKRLFAPVSADRLWRLAVDEPRGEADSSRWNIPVLGRDGAVDFFHAVGECNEVREVFRRCIEGGYRLDDVEILYTQRDTYLPLIYELAWHWAAEADVPPVTFAEGIPCSFSRPGQALSGWLEWLGGDCPQTLAVRMLRDGLLALPGEAEADTRSLALASEILAGLGIWFGRGRYLSVIERAILETEGKLALPSDSQDADASEQSARTDRRLARLASLQSLRALFTGLLDLSPRIPGAGAADMLAAADRFLAEFAHGRTELDANARNRLRNEIGAMAGLAAEQMIPPDFNAVAWLTDLIGTTRVEANAPRPGSIHVAPVLAGGHSGRGHTFILGLDDTRFPGGASQDPLLLDMERMRLSPELPTGALRLRRSIEEFERMLARLRGKAIFSFVSRSVTDDRELFPSSMLLAIYRETTGQRDADPSAMLRALGNPASFAPSSGAKCAFPGEEWLAACIVEGCDGTDLARQTYPSLEAGEKACEARDSLDFTEYDGNVGVCVGSLPEVFSAGMLETAGACPRRFWYRYVLGIKPPEDREVEPGQWLDNAKFGSLLHAVFREYMDRCIKEQRLPDLDDREELESILMAMVERYKGAIPPPSDDVYQRTLSDLRWTVTRFLRVESQFCRKSIPVACEAAVGMENDEGRTVLDAMAPVEIAFKNRCIKLRGKIDRVDRSSSDPDSYSVWDYKTGSHSKYRQHGPFYEGRMLQAVLYPEVVQARLQETVDFSARVDRFGYFCPSRRGKGERVAWTAEQLHEGYGIMEDLLKLLDHGAFTATTCEKDCGYCDFGAICGDVKRLTQQAKAKTANTSSAVLEPFRRLRNIKAVSPEPESGE